MNRKKISVVICIAFLITTLLALPSMTACGTKAPKEEVYEFGCVFPMTGPAAFIGEIFVAAVNQAVDEINAAGGMDGTMLKAVIEDHQGAAKPGADAMNKLALNKKIAYVIESFVEPPLAAQPIAERNKILIVCAAGQTEQLLHLPYLYVNHVMSNYQMPPLAEFIYAKGLRKMAGLNQNNPEGLDNDAAFVRTWEKLGGTVVAEEVFDVMDMDFATQLTKIKAAQPDTLYMTAVALQASTILKQRKELGITAQVCGPWLEDPATMIPAGPNVDGAISVCTYLNPETENAFGRDFIKNYNEKYGPEGVTAYWPWADAYENVYILTELVKRVRAKGGDIHNGEQLLNALLDNPEFKSVFGQGKLRFTEDHDVLKDVSINLVQGGQVIPQKIVPYNELKKG